MRHLVEILIEGITEEEANECHEMIRSTMSPEILLSGPPDREKIEGYLFEGLYDKSAWRFSYDDNHEDDLKKVLFKLELKYDNVEFRELFSVPDDLNL